ncbi:MAG TPA: response regulator transcription factor [Chitinophagales bacterium]|nr:response regulator transcription factor [Chitinophagales bacterium]
MKVKIQVVIVEDDRELRNLLEQLIGKQDDMEVTKSFSNGRSFINDFKSLDVDVVIMDINMPGKTGIECVSETKHLRSDVQFLISTSFENHEYIFQALCAGATGYLLKSSKPAELIEAIRQINQGGSPMSMQIARLVVGSFQTDKKTLDSVNELSTREKEIIHWLAQGLVYKEIGEKLFISPQTVRTHIRNIYEKLQVSSKTEAINKVFPRNA